jgi:hypothetical protein
MKEIGGDCIEMGYHNGLWRSGQKAPHVRTCLWQNSSMRCASAMVDEARTTT